jgi:hypothetical protein
MVSDGKLPMILLTSTDALLFIESSLISLVILFTNALFSRNFTVYYDIIFTQVTVSALRQDMIYDIGTLVRLYSFYLLLNANTRMMVIGYTNG